MSFRFTDGVPISWRVTLCTMMKQNNFSANTFKLLKKENVIQLIKLCNTFLCADITTLVKKSSDYRLTHVD